MLLPTTRILLGLHLKSRLTRGSTSRDRPSSVPSSKRLYGPESSAAIASLRRPQLGSFLTRWMLHGRRTCAGCLVRAAVRWHVQ
ncbi:hypothetical protein RB213_011766 [Colletotrichum asianum]